MPVALEPTFIDKFPLAKEPPVEGSPLFLLQNVWKTLTDEGLL